MILGIPTIGKRMKRPLRGGEGDAKHMAVILAKRWRLYRLRAKGYGLTISQFRLMKQRYREHKYHARRKSIEFALSFDDWFAIWSSSGKLTLRGRGRGKYCMARKLDRGAYIKGNVDIILFTRNVSDAFKHGAHSGRSRHVGPKQLGRRPA